MKSKPTRGGSRAGAGRKPQDAAQPRNIPKSIKVSEQVADYLTDVGTGVIEDTIRGSKQFREWIKSNASR
jgi:hypothetical protein